MCFFLHCFNDRTLWPFLLAAEGKKMKGIVVKWNNFRSIEIYFAVNLREGGGKEKGQSFEVFID